MIPHAAITAWRPKAPWPTSAQTEQDLVLTRAIVEIFADPFLRESLAFRGGTALQKLFLASPVRYSEDIDLVQRRAEPIGPVLNAIRAKLDPWLGRPKWELAKASASLVYRFDSEIPPIQKMRLKIEANTREHFSVLGYQSKTLTVHNLWFEGSAEVVTYNLEELMGTKMRALYQRKKGRDLFDLHYVLESHPTLEDRLIISCFRDYLAFEQTAVSRAEFEANMHEKLKAGRFHNDIAAVLHSDRTFDVVAAYAVVHKRLIAPLPGKAWKGLEK